MVELDEEIVLEVVDGLVAMISIPFTCPIYALCVVLGGVAGRGGTVLLSRTKNGGKDSGAAHIIIFMIIRDERTGNAESTYHVESHKAQTPDLAFSHHRRRDRTVLQVMTKTPTGTWVGPAISFPPRNRCSDHENVKQFSRGIRLLDTLDGTTTQRMTANGW
jgi:hypothetical protein